jgi:hypothetical protein
MNKITTSLISKNSYALIGNNVEAFLMIIFMHYHGRITDAKMHGMFKGLRLNFTGYTPFSDFGKKNYFPNYKPKNVTPLLRYVKTYHNTINDSWYNDESMYTILQETFYEAVLTKKEMDMKTFMGYVNKFLCKGKKECYEFVHNEVIEAILQMLDVSYNFDRGVNLLQELGIINNVSYPSFDRYEVWGYCCDDCDGDFDDYKQRQYHENVVKRLKDEIKENLTKKTKQL